MPAEEMVAKNPSGRRNIKSEGFGERTSLGFGLHEQTPVNYPAPITATAFPPGTQFNKIFDEVERKLTEKPADRPKKAPLLLMDDIHAMTFQTKFDGMPIAAESRKILATYRAKLRSAEKFVLDDEAVRFNCNLSHQSDMMEMHAVLARLPFDVMYLEMNLHVKVLEYERLGKLSSGRAQLDQVPKEIGYLFYRDGESGARWICHDFKRVPKENITGGNGEVVIPGIISFVFDPEGGLHNPVAGSLTWRSPTLSKRGIPKVKSTVRFNPADADSFETEGEVDPEFVLAGDLTSRGIEGFGIEDNGMGPSQDVILARDWFMGRGAAIIDPFWDCHLNIIKGLGKYDEKYNDLIMRECIEQAGIMRFLVALLASINAVPREIKQANTRTGQRQVSGRILPYFQHRTISLKLPRDNRIQWARKIMRASYRNQPRAWHPVRGHWRIIERGKAKARGRLRGQAFCHHHPEMVENDVAICNKCEMIIRWIPNHQRGDPNVGIVNHTYKVSA